MERVHSKPDGRSWLCTYLCNRYFKGSTYTTRLYTCECSVDIFHTDFSNLVIVVKVAHAEGTTVITGKEDFVGVREKNRRFMRKRKRRVRCNLVKGRVGTEDVEERLIKDLKKWDLGITRVEELGERVVAKISIRTQHCERRGVDKLMKHL